MENNYKNDIDQLLFYSSESIKNLKSDSKDLKVQVKNILENLRSSLEYTAQHINFILNNKNRKSYFPYSNTKDNFENSVNKNLPNLIVKEKWIYELIKSLQPFECGDSWLIDLCNSTNIVKHSKSIDLENTTSIEKRLTIIGSDGINIIGGNLHNTDITFIGNYVNGKRTDDFKIIKGDQVFFKSGDVAIEFGFEIIENNVIVIKDVQKNLIDFLNNCHDKIKNFISKIFATEDLVDSN